MEIKKTQAAIEAILFTMGNSVEAEKIAKAIEQDTQTTEKTDSTAFRWQGLHRGQ